MLLKAELCSQGTALINLSAHTSCDQSHPGQSQWEGRGCLTYMVYFSSRAVLGQELVGNPNKNNNKQIKPLSPWSLHFASIHLPWSKAYHTYSHNSPYSSPLRQRQCLLDISESVDSFSSTKHTHTHMHAHTPTPAIPPRPRDKVQIPYKASEACGNLSST